MADSDSLSAHPSFSVFCRAAARASLVIGCAVIILLASGSNVPSNTAQKIAPLALQDPTIFIAIRSAPNSSVERAAWRSSCCASAYASANISWQFVAGVPQSVGHRLTAHIQGDQATAEEKGIESRMKTEIRLFDDLEILAMRDVSADQTDKLLGAMRHFYETTNPDYLVWHGDETCVDPETLLKAVREHRAKWQYGPRACLGLPAGSCDGGTRSYLLTKEVTTKVAKETGKKRGAHYSAERYTPLGANSSPGLPDSVGPHGAKAVVGSVPGSGRGHILLYGGVTLRSGRDGESSKDGSLAPYFTDEFVVVNRDLLFYVTWRDWAHSLFWAGFGSGNAASNLGKVIARCVDRLSQAEGMVLAVSAFPSTVLRPVGNVPSTACSMAPPSPSAAPSRSANATNGEERPR